MIEEVGTVVELKQGDRAVVLCQQSSACRHCDSKGACHLGEDDRTRLVEAYNPLHATVGDQVKIGIGARTLLQSSFLVYIVPLIALLVGAGLGQLLGNRLENGPNPDLLAAILGSAFLAGAFLVIKVGSRALPKDNYMPRITGIVSRDGAPNHESTHGH